MRILTRDEPQTPQVLQIPEKIQTDIEEKGFHLYKWITPEEVKLSIERDFLKTLKYIGIPLGILAIIAGLLTVFGFFVVIFFGIFFMFLYLLFLSLRRSQLLSKSAFVVLTDSSISLGGKIVKLSEIKHLHDDMKHIEEKFEEKLFEDSKLTQSKSTLTKEVLDQLFGGYSFIFNNTGRRWGMGNSRDSEKFLLVVLALYTIYVAVMSVVYFVGVFFLWIFGNIMTKLNTWYLMHRGHTVLEINELFWKIDRSSQDIKSEKIQIGALLDEAHDNNWQDGLLTKIEAGLREINRSANRVVDEVTTLRNTIESSKYKGMFSYSIYNSWVKKQVADPLENILRLLKKHRNILTETQEEIEDQLSQTTKHEHKAALTLQIKRLQMQQAEIEKYIPMLESAVEKLQS